MVMVYSTNRDKQIDDGSYHYLSAVQCSAVLIAEDPDSRSLPHSFHRMMSTVRLYTEWPLSSFFLSYMAAPLVKSSIDQLIPECPFDEPSLLQ